MSATHINELAAKAVPYLLGVIIALGGLVWSDVKSTLQAVQLIQFQQIKDGKDLERHARDIDNLEARVGRMERRPERDPISEVLTGFGIVK